LYRELTLYVAHRPPLQPPSTRVGPFCLIFIILMLFLFSIFSCALYASLVPLPLPYVDMAPFHLVRATQPLSYSSNDSLSFKAPFAAVQPPAFRRQTRVLVRGGLASYMGYPLPRAPSSVGRKPCGQGPPYVGQMGLNWTVSSEFIRRIKVVDATSRLQTGGLQVPVLWDVLSCLRVLVAPRLSRSLWGTGGGRCIGPPAPVVPVQGLHGRPLFFPVSPRPWGSPVWSPSATLTSRKWAWIALGQVDSRIGYAWVFWSRRWGPLGLRRLRFPWRGPREAASFPWSVPILGFSFSAGPGRRPCRLFTRSEGLTGGPCLSPQCCPAGSIRIQLLCHNFIRSRGPHR
jgi:hypothetical protein